MLPVLKRTGAKRLGRALACRAGGDVAAVELPPHVARAGNAELELRQSGRIHVRATGGARRVQRRREDAACARNRRREERDRSNRCKRDDTAPADRRSRDARTPGPSFLSLCRDNRLLLLVRGGRLLLLDRALKSARLGPVFEQGDDRSSRGSLRCGRAATCCGPRPFQGGGPIFGAHSVLGGGERGRRRGPRLGRQPLATLGRPMPNLLQMRSDPCEESRAERVEIGRRTTASGQRHVRRRDDAEAIEDLPCSRPRRPVRRGRVRLSASSVSATS